MTKRQATDGMLFRTPQALYCGTFLELQKLRMRSVVEA